MALRRPRSAVLVDQHPLWLEAVEQVVKSTGTEVVGKTTRFEAARTLVTDRQPDLLLTEIDNGDGDADGAAFIRRALAQSPHTKVVVLSAHARHDVVTAALGAGAVAYVVKTTHPDDLASVLRQAFDHSVYLANSALAFATPPAVGHENPLTPREREIVQLVAEGNSNADVARELWLSEQTVKVHLSNAYRKLGVSNRTEAARWAQVNGLIPARRRLDPRRERV